MMGTASSGDEPMLDINTTPLIDVMLVLIIMFIITLPVQLHQIALDLSVPAPAQQRHAAPARVLLELHADGRMVWDGRPLRDGSELGEEMARLAALRPQPQLQLKPDANVAYRQLAAALATAQRQGVGELALTAATIKSP